MRLPHQSTSFDAILQNFSKLPDRVELKGIKWISSFNSYRIDDISLSFGSCLVDISVFGTYLRRFVKFVSEMTILQQRRPTLLYQTHLQSYLYYLGEGNSFLGITVMKNRNIKKSVNLLKHSLYHGNKPHLEPIKASYINDNKR